MILFIFLLILEFVLKFLILRKTHINNPYTLDISYVIICIIPIVGIMPAFALLEDAFGELKSKEIINKILFIKKEEK